MNKREKVMAITWLATVLFIFVGVCNVFGDKPSDEPELVITPSEVTMTTREQLQFRVEVRDGGDIDISSINIEWKVMGNIGEISPDGLFVASDKPGRGMVRVSAKVEKKQLTAYALVMIAEGGTPPGPTKHIVVTVSPESVALPRGGRQPFTATPQGDTQWRVIPPKIGSITEDGLFIAGQDFGKGIIVASVQTDDGKGTGRAEVLVGGETKFPPGQKLKVNVTPKHARVDNGGSTEFRAKVTGLEDESSLEWEVNPSGLGHIEGSGDRVLFVAGNDLRGRALITAIIRAEMEIAMDWATVDVGVPGKIPPAKIKVSVIPDEASITVGNSMLFSASIAGKEFASVSWSVAPKKIGIINDNGFFTATAPGWGLIIAKVDDAAGVSVGQARIFVGTEGDTGVSIVILPQTAETYVRGSSVDFDVQVADAQGIPLADVPIDWKVVPSNMGTIDKTGNFSPGNKPGHALVTARLKNAKESDTAYARVTINEQADIGRLIVSISGQEFPRVGKSYTYIASITDPTGAVVDPAGLEIKWRLAPASLGELQGNGVSATFIPGKTGRGVIILDLKSASGKGSGRISIVVES